MQAEMSQPLPRSRKLLPLASAVSTVILLVLAWGWIRFAPGRLHRLAKTGDVGGLRFALELGADPNARSTDEGGKIGGIRPLMEAGYWCQLDCAATLIMAGADVNAEDNLGRSVLWHAAGCPEVMRLLVSSGADVNRCHTNLNGILIPDSSVTFAVILRGDNASVQVLVEAGIDPRAACFKDSLLEGLVKHGARSDAVLAPLLQHARGRMDGMEAQYLLAAAEGRARESCRVLLDMGIAVDSSGPSGKTPLMAAAGSRSVEVVELLLDRGADRTLKDKAGKTALDYLEQAETRGLRSDRIELLRGMLAIGDGGE
jgi:ankyrin repeat protein